MKLLNGDPKRRGPGFRGRPGPYTKVADRHEARGLRNRARLRARVRRWKIPEEVKLFLRGKAWIFRARLRVRASEKAIEDLETGQAYMIDTHGKDGIAYPLPRPWSQDQDQDQDPGPGTLK